MESKAEELERKMKLSVTLATLEDHPGWQMIAELLDAQIANNQEALCQPGLPSLETEALRNDVRVMRWCRSASQQASPENYAEWERALAFQRKQEKMRSDGGLPPGGR
tara:strand:- start:24994 stop:25317 length:324 start_codon:yes stop_codon:yes gene_type:complete